MSEVVKASSQPRRAAWETPALKAVGTISQVLENGGGKPSVSPGDPGEPRKVTSQG